jgi:hypothetical protein
MKKTTYNSIQLPKMKSIKDLLRMHEVTFGYNSLMLIDAAFIPSKRYAL